MGIFRNEDDEEQHEYADGAMPMKKETTVSKTHMKKTTTNIMDTTNTTIAHTYTTAEQTKDDSAGEDE